MIPAAVLLGAVTAERLADLWLARRNTADLLAKGAREFAPSRYSAIVLLHAFWLVGLWLFGCVVRSSSWDENRAFREDDKLEVAVKNRGWAMTHLPAGSRQNQPVEHYFPTE
jgi:hypothetical protein